MNGQLGNKSSELTALLSISSVMGRRVAMGWRDDVVKVVAGAVTGEREGRVDSLGGQQRVNAGDHSCVWLAVHSQELRMFCFLCEVRGCDIF